MATQFGKYEVERELGRGACGITYLAVDPALKRKVALKVLQPPSAEAVGQTQAIERFAREARTAAAIRHPAVPQIFEVGQAAGRCYIAMELCEGQTLKDMLTMQGPMHTTRAVQIIRQVLLALQAAHSLGITHRDVKPDNVMLMPDDTIKLMDFGIARMSSEPTLTQTGTLLGTPAYMSPEQILGQTVDGRSDLFSTGVMLYEMIMGRRPFEGQTLTQITHAIAYEPPQLAAAMPAHLRDLVAMALEKDPAHRFQTAREMVDALDSGRSPKPVKPQATPPGLPAPPGPLPVPSGTAASSGVAATLVAAPGTVPGVPSGGGQPPAPPGTPSALTANTNLRPCPSCGRAVSVYATACPGCGHPFHPPAAYPAVHPGYSVHPGTHPGYAGSTTPPAVYAAHPAQRAVPPGYIQRSSGHSPANAVALGLLCCISAGQFYNGQILKGIVLGIVAVGAALATAGWAVLLLYPLYLVDAGLVASRLSRGELVSEWQFF